MVASTLPQEILDHILSFLEHDSRTLAACCSASKLLSETSRSILYRNLRIQEHALERTNMIFRLHSHLASYIREIEIFTPWLGVPWLSRFDPSILDRAYSLDKLSFYGVPWSQLTGRIRDFLLRIDATAVELHHHCRVHPSDLAEFLCSFSSLRKVVLANVMLPAKNTHDADTIRRHSGAVARSTLYKVKLHELEVLEQRGNVAVQLLLEDALDLSKLHTLALQTTCRLSDPLLHEFVCRAPDIVNLSLNVPFEATDAHLFTGLFPRLESLCLNGVRIGFDEVGMSGPNTILGLISGAPSLPHSFSRVTMGGWVHLKSNAPGSFPDSTTDVEWTALDRSLKFVPHVIRMRGARWK
ncbi:hypothetical protein FISHEDRAFT_73446 [Fistulina hepatica ATCC 64428]|uniref:F-box domain-containing protein n=1 Tax=Fistulina hepatica ATCC 64428 TaxID=1128425 RepID=A0A0D7AD49_9AGAR|nr:hypothetical protein FISHEDRAFT_73446 [Fistulina hepatica ATCC 64428]